MSSSFVPPKRDPIKGVEAGRRAGWIQHDHLAASFPSMLDDHWRDLAGRIEHNEAAAPFERGRDCHGRRLETSGPGKDDPVR